MERAQISYSGVLVTGILAMIGVSVILLVVPMEFGTEPAQSSDLVISEPVVTVPVVIALTAVVVGLLSHIKRRETDE